MRHTTSRVSDSVNFCLFPSSLLLLVSSTFQHEAKKEEEMNWKVFRFLASIKWKGKVVNASIRNMPRKVVNWIEWHVLVACRSDIYYDVCTHFLVPHSAHFCLLNVTFFFIYLFIFYFGSIVAAIIAVIVVVKESIRCPALRRQSTCYSPARSFSCALTLFLSKLMENKLIEIDYVSKCLTIFTSGIHPYHFHFIFMNSSLPQEKNYKKIVKFRNFYFDSFVSHLK
jgi:hypothetical protein